jgi:hypothetical protein
VQSSIGSLTRGMHPDACRWDAAASLALPEPSTNRKPQVRRRLHSRGWMSTEPASTRDRLLSGGRGVSGESTADVIAVLHEIRGHSYGGEAADDEQT